VFPPVTTDPDESVAVELWLCASVCWWLDPECVCVSEPPVVVIDDDAGLGTTEFSVA